MNEYTAKGREGVRFDMKLKQLPESRLITMSACQKMTGALRFYFNPYFKGLEHIDSQTPCLIVANHTVYGLIDVPLMLSEIYRTKGVLVRSLGDHLHYRIPGWRYLLMKWGMVPGTREDCSALMAQRKHLLVFPGGGNEVFRCKGEQYKLIWKQRTGFVRLAVEHGYPIVPAAQVGIDHALTILFDGKEMLSTPLLGAFLTRTGLKKHLFRNGETIPPIVRGVGPSMLPRPERLYFSFGKPIETTSYAGKQDDSELLMEIRNKVADGLNREIASLLRLRAQDKGKGFRQLMRRL